MGIFKTEKHTARCCLFLIFNWVGRGGGVVHFSQDIFYIYSKIQFYDKELLARLIKSEANTDEQTYPNSRVSTEVEKHFIHILYVTHI